MRKTEHTTLERIHEGCQGGISSAWLYSGVSAENCPERRSDHRSIVRVL